MALSKQLTEAGAYPQLPTNDQKNFGCVGSCGYALASFKIKAFGPKKSVMQGLKCSILAIFQNGLGWLFPVSSAIKNPLQGSKTRKVLFF